jgi:two-component system sensor histidine kinase DesK
VIGDAAGLPAPVQVALGWVVREATTNIIRHSDPRTVRIDLEVGPAALLRIENDGVSGDANEKPWGNGLVGLSERLVTLGGDLVAKLEPDGRFLVQARLPLPGLQSPGLQSPEQRAPEQQLPASS